MPPSTSPREHIQFSIRTLLILALLVALVTPICQWAWKATEDPLGLFGAIGIGMAAGLVTVQTLRHVPAGLLLFVVLLVFDLVNGFWISGRFLEYCSGMAAGAILAWKGMAALNALLDLCGFTVSTTVRAHKRDEANVNE